MPADRPFPDALANIAASISDALTRVLPAGTDWRTRLTPVIEATIDRLDLVPREIRTSIASSALEPRSFAVANTGQRAGAEVAVSAVASAEHVAVLSRAECGIDAPQVVIETQIAGGIPGFSMVGLPEIAVREAR
jgi:hypothetical protein